MNHYHLPASFRRSAIAIAASTLWLLPALGSQAAGPGPIGGEFQVNLNTALNQVAPAVASDADGDFVVVWQHDFSATDQDIRGRRYSASGQPLGNEFSVSGVGGATDETAPSIAMDANGNFVVAWVTNNEGGQAGNFGIQAQRYNASGVAQGSVIAVNTVNPEDQTNPAIAIDADGDFVVAWETAPAPSSVLVDIRARRFNGAGLAQGAEIAVGPGSESEINPAVAVDADGDFVVVWENSGFSQSDLRAQRYDAAGLPMDLPIAVNSEDPEESASQPSVAMDADGDFVVAWTHYGPSAGFDFGIRARRYNASGVLEGGEITVAGIGLNPAVALDADGDFVVAWRFFDNRTDLRARRYSATGLPQGGAFDISTFTSADKSSVAVTLDADGDFVIAWTSFASSNAEIRARRFQGSDPVDVSLFQTDSADPAPVGSPLTYTLSVGNLQTPVTPTGIATIDSAIGSASGLRVLANVPSSSGLTTAGSFWTCNVPIGPALLMTCDYGQRLLAGEEAPPLTITLNPSSPAGQQIRNVARVAANQFDDDLLNNRDVERTQLVCAESVIQLSASEIPALENFASVTITATRSGGACGLATVQYDTAGSSATPGLDFTDVTGTLTWADGDLANKTFTIPILSDVLDEIDERIQVSLSGARGASLGTRTAARVTIADDDAAPRINFSSSGQSSTEKAGVVMATARLGVKSGRNVTVPLTFTGTATNASDYFPTGSALTIAAGEMEASVDIEIVDDSATEPSETLVIGMGTVSGATVGTVNTHTITIADDDVAAAPTVSFELPTASGTEATATNVRVLLSAASAQIVTVPYTRGGVASFPADYSVNLSSPITFNPGQVEKMIVITPVDDAVDEPNENLVLTLGTPTNATLGAGVSHRRTIVDNDP